MFWWPLTWITWISAEILHVSEKKFFKKISNFVFQSQIRFRGGERPQMFFYVAVTLAGHLTYHWGISWNLVTIQHCSRGIIRFFRQRPWHFSPHSTESFSHGFSKRQTERSFASGDVMIIMIGLGQWEEIVFIGGQDVKENTSLFKGLLLLIRTNSLFVIKI